MNARLIRLLAQSDSADEERKKRNQGIARRKLFLDKEVDNITRNRGSVLEFDWSIGARFVDVQAKMKDLSLVRSQSTVKGRDSRVIRSSAQKDEPIYVGLSPIRRGDRSVIEGVGSFIVNSRHLPSVQVQSQDQSSRWKSAAFDGLEDESCQLAVLQSLANSPGFLDDFFLDPDKLRWQLNPKADLKGKLCMVLAELVKKARASHNRKTVIASDFLALLSSQTVQYTQSRSVSPIGFYSTLLQALHRELNLVKEQGPTPVVDFDQRSSVASVAADYLTAAKRCDNSAVRDYFLVQLTRQLTCKVCKHKTFTNSLDYCIHLPFPNTDVWRYLDLYKCLSAALSKKPAPQEVCPNCLRRGPVEVQSFLTRLPPLLVFHFDRGAGMNLDMDSELMFPMTGLDLSIYGPVTPKLYSLYSIVSYKTASTPPVLASCNLIEGRWLEYSQGRSTQTSVQGRSATASLLFYNVSGW